MTSSDASTDDQRAGQPVQPGQVTVDPDALRQLADRLHQAVTATFADVSGATAKPDDTRAASSFGRPVAVPPVRMEQMTRTPEPTADLDDLVDLLVPRLVEQLVPALRQALRDDV